jgi:hypothetical protein
MMAGQIVRPQSAFTLDGRRTLTKRPRQTSAGHLEWLRTLPSVVRGTGPIEAAHIRFGDPRYAKPKVGMAEKPDDKFALPLAADQHRAQHAGSERAFWDKHGIDPVLVAALLWLHSGNDEAGRHIISRAEIIGK